VKYNQPYGVSDPNAPYVNGNPSTGTMGSIPPAASIEYPQREIVNLIADAGLAAPDNADLHQLAKSVQSMLLISDDDAGTANAYQVTMTPAPTAYFKYMTVVCVISNTNTGPSVLNVNALGPKPIRHPADNSELSNGELKQNAIACFVFDGTFFHLVWSSGGISAVSGSPIYLTAPKTLYVNGTTGDDTAYDGSSATVVAGTIHGPYKTIQRASNECMKYNLNGYNIAVNVAPGAYVTFFLISPGGAGRVIFLGNNATPAATLITGTNASAIGISGAGLTEISGFKMTTSGSSPNDTCSALNVGSTARVWLHDVDLGQCSGSQLVVSRNSVLTLWGNITLSGGSSLTGFAGGSFLSCFMAASVETNPPTTPLYFNVPAPISYTNAFINCLELGITGVTWSSFTGFANVTGLKFNVTLNGVISTAGSGVNYYPGNIAGATASGGQYA
jgi:hypothetical protein